MHDDISLPAGLSECLQQLGDQSFHFAADLLAPLREQLARLTDPLLRVCVLGAYKAGTTSVVNALLGVRLTPPRAAGQSNAAVTIEYADAPRVRIHHQNGTVHDDSLDDIGPATRDATVMKIDIGVPLPRLHGCTLTDLPGGALTDRISAHLYRTDLAIFVLAADKLLGSGDRVAIGAVNAALGGNIVCVLNRMDAIDEEDVEEIESRAARALSGTGNDLVGAGRLFRTSLPPGGSPQAGVDSLLAWFDRMLTSPVHDALRLRARYSRFEHTLASVQGEAQDRLRDRQSRLSQLEEEEQRRAEARSLAVSRLRSDGERLREVAASLPTYEARFMETGRREADDALRTNPDMLHLHLRGPMEMYADAVTTAARAAVLESGMPVSDLRLTNLIVRLDIPVPHRPGSNLGEALGSAATGLFDGGKTGKALGSSLGGWVDRTVLGTGGLPLHERVDQHLAATLSAVHREAELYLGSIRDGLEAGIAVYERQGPAEELLSLRAEVAELTDLDALLRAALDLVSTSRAHDAALSIGS